jgi:hypothetical protein
MDALTIEPATRQGIVPLIGMYGKTGSGKTFSALMLARGFVGPTGRIVLIDTENRRASIYADMIPGGFRVINLQPPFSPERYAEAHTMIEKDCDIGIIDSASHLWSGEHGILEAQEAELQRMAGDDYKRREACKMAAWIKPKARYNVWFQRVLRTKVPLIVCLRGQEKTHMLKKDGKNVVVTDEFSTPIFDGRFIFEMIANIETINLDGKPGCGVIRKWSHPDVLACLPKPGEQISQEHGAALAKWCAGKPTAAPAPAPDSPKPTPPPAKALKAELWDLTQPIHQSEPGDSKAAKQLAAGRLEQWLWDEGILADTESLAEIGAERMAEVLASAKEKMKI